MSRGRRGRVRPGVRAEGPRRGPRAGRSAAGGDRAGPCAARAGGGARPAARERRLPLRPQRDRRHGRDALPGGARPRGRRGRGAGRRGRLARPWHARRALGAAGVRAVRGVPAGARPLVRDGVPAACCIPIPDGVPFEIAALAGCAVATGTGAVWRTADVRPGDRVAVIGCGGVGMSALLGAVAVGAQPVVAVDVAEPKLAAAEALGATHTVAWAGSAEATAELVVDASAGGVDCAIEATGRPEAALAAFLSTRARGAAVLVGIPAADATITLPALPIPRLERRILGSIYGSSRPGRDFPALLELYRRGRLPLDRLVSRRLPLDAVEDAFAAMRGGDALRVVLDLGGTT